MKFLRKYYASMVEGYRLVRERTYGEYVCILLGVLTLQIILFALLYLWISPDQLPSKALIEQFISIGDNLRPERKERLLYQSLLLLLPLSLLAADYVVCKIFYATYSKRRLALVFANLVTVSAVLGLSGYLYFAFQRSAISDLVLGFAYRQPIVYVLAIVAAANIGFSSLRDAAPFTTASRSWTLAIAILAAFYVTLPWQIITANGVDLANGLYMNHYPAVIYSFSQAASGLMPIIDFPSQYGFLGEILSPVWHLIGFGLFQFSLTMALLHALSICAFIAFVYQTFKNTWVAFLLSLSIVYLAENYVAVAEAGEKLLQVYPIRILFPYFSLLLITRFRFDSRRFTALSGVFSGVAMIVNIDSGIPVCGAFTGTLMIFGISKLAAGQITAGGLLRAMMTFIAGVAVPIVLFYAGLEYLAGGTEALKNLFQYQSLFYISGYFMLPLPGFPHLWHLIVLIFGVAFVLGMAGCMKAEISDIDIRLLYTSILAFGLFTYFQGRSHDYNLAPILVWSVTLFGMIVQKSAARFVSVRGRWQGQWIANAAFVYVTALFAIGLILESPVITGRWNELLASGSLPRSDFSRNVEYLRKAFSNDNDCYIVSHPQGLYLAEIPARGPRGLPGINEIALVADERKIESMIDHGTFPCVVIGRDFAVKPSMFGSALSRISDKYVFVDKSPDGSLAHWVLRK